MRGAVSLTPTEAAGGQSSESKDGRPHVLHVFATFKVGGPQVLLANVVNHLGAKFRHTFIATDGRYDFRARVSDDVDADYLPVVGDGRCFFGRIASYRRVLHDLQPDLLTTCNWGAIEWALAHRLGPVCPHLHFEHGFGPEEVAGQIWRRVWFRRIALKATTRFVVPSRTLVDIAERIWRLNPSKIIYVPNGVSVAKFAEPPRPGVVAGFEKQPDDIIVGTLAPLRPEKNLGRLLKTFAAVAHRARLLIVGDGPEREMLEALARDLGVKDRVIFAGHVDAPEQVLRWFDVFAITSITEQMPIALLEAMAAGLPVVGVDVGDVKLNVASENRDFIVPQADQEGFQSALERLLNDGELRHRLGRLNRGRIETHYAESRMLRAYEELITGLST